MEKRYSISDAAKQVSVEAHVLRYWEEELNLHIQRNAQGHRFYLEEDISILKSIKDLKEQGFQLKAIKMVLPDIKVVRTLEPQKLYRLREELNRQVQGEDAYTPAPVQTAQVMPLHPNRNQNHPISQSGTSPETQRKLQEEKLRHFEAMMRKMIRSTVEEMEQESEERICEKITTKLLKELDYLTRQKAELHDKQIALLEQILSEVRGDLPEVAASKEREKREPSAYQRKQNKQKNHRKKLFAK